MLGRDYAQVLAYRVARLYIRGDRVGKSSTEGALIEAVRESGAGEKSGRAINFIY